MKTYIKLCFALVTVFLSSCGGSSDSISEQAVSDDLTLFRTTRAGVSGLVVPGAVADVYSAPSSHMIVPQGVANLETGEKMQTSSLFHVGSLTKTFTAAWIMQLDQEGTLSIEDPISKYLSFPLGDQISLRQLLSHTSGITSFTAMPEFANYYAAHPYPTQQDILKFMRDHHRQSFAPGQSYEYSNSGYYLLGLIGEAASGKTWHEEIRRRFLDRYNLDSTYIYGLEEGPATGQGYVACSSADGCNPPQMIAYGSDADYRLGWAAGAIVSSPRDLARWMALLVSGPVLDTSHRQEMQTVTPQSAAVMQAQGELYYSFNKGVGLSLFQYYTPEAGYGWGHEGQIGGFGNVASYFLDVETGFAICANDISADVDRGLKMIVQAAFPPQ